jgi:hypothetical protein
MGFLDMFTKDVVQAPAAASSSPAPSSPAPTTGVQGVQGATTANPFALAPETPPVESPVTDYSKLWEPIAAPTPAPGTVPADPNAETNRIVEQAKGMDFTKVIPAEVFTKIQNGGPEAQGALAEALNVVAQAAYAQSHYASAATIKEAIKEARNEFQKEIPDIIRRHNVTDVLRGNDPRYNDPEIAPLLQAIDQQITLKFPQATSSQIADMRTQYLDRVAGKFSPSKDVPEVKDSRNGDVEDWDAFLRGGPNSGR